MLPRGRQPCCQCLASRAGAAPLRIAAGVPGDRDRRIPAGDLFTRRDTAIIAVTVHTVGALGKMFYEGRRNADMRAEEGLRAVGGSWLERVWFGIVPQVMPNFLDTHAALEINVRASTIIGAVGAGGIGEPLRLSIGQAHEAKTPGHHHPAFHDHCDHRPDLGRPSRRLVGDQAFEFGR